MRGKNEEKKKEEKKKHEETKEKNEEKITNEGKKWGNTCENEEILKKLGKLGEKMKKIR